MAFFKSSSVCSFHSPKGMYCVLKPLCRRKSESACKRSSAPIPKSSPVYLEYLIFMGTASVILTPYVRPLRRPLFPRPFALALPRPELALLVAADAPVRVQALQHKLRGRHAHCIRLVGRKLQCLELFHQALDGSQRPHHGRR